MEKSKIKEAWDICEVEKLEQFNAYRISPAVFKPEIDSDFIFKDRGETDELWNDVKSMENVSFMMEPLDGYLRGQVFVYVDDDIRGEISFKSYKDKIKISPGDEDSSFEVFEYFIENFEKHVCELTFLGGLDKMK